MIDTNNNTNKGFNTNAYNTSNKANKAGFNGYNTKGKVKGKVSNNTSNKANNKANNNNNNNILANALIDYVACIDSVSNICIKYNITRQAFYKYKSKLAGFYNIDYDIKHKQSKKAFLLFNTAPTLNLLFHFHSLNTLPNVLFALLASPHVVYRSNLSLPPLLYIFIFSLYTIFCFLSRSYLDFVSVAINLLICRAILFYKCMNLHNGYMYLHFEIFL
ncbi:hypothetical protein [Helicobacter bilis]|uniref:hypothetical protein n=1 Tax=Helicobacter bilis TaxID=37372 RepID=UPI001F33FACD|nr:hypothetical protein [Helicobacter bilis]